MTGQSKGIFVTLIAQLIWGAATPLVKISLDYIPPFSYLFLRCLFTATILFVLLELRFIKPPPKFTWSEKKTIFYAGITGVFLNIGLYFLGQRLTSVSDAGIIMSTSTIFIVTYSFLFLKERLASKVYLGITIAFIGSLIIIGSPLLGGSQGNVLGNALLLAAVGCGVISYLITKRLVAKLSPLYLTYCFFTVSLPFAALPMLIEFYYHPTWMASVPLPIWGILVYTIIGSSILAYYFSNLGLRYLSASLGSVLGYVGGIIALLASFFVLKEHLSVFFAIGSIIITIGLILAETRHRQTSRQKTLAKPRL